jgi:hypothetical protein
LTKLKASYIIIVFSFYFDFIRIKKAILIPNTNHDGLGIFIAMLELMFSIIRPEWKEICRSAKKNTDPSIDVDVLEPKVIDRNTIRQASRFKMTKQSTKP